jgi:FtsP/CotA-like multicopper oxidase with cupredoxin domain
VKFGSLFTIAVFILTACVFPGQVQAPIPAPGVAAAHAGHEDAAGHMPNAGPLLGNNDGRESVAPGTRCAPAAPLRAYHVIAINVQITLNRYLDYDPQGRMYVLEEDLARVRQEEAQNKAARASKGEMAVSLGLQGDAIQPLVLRVNQGECLRVTLRNDLTNNEPASLHIHGSSLYVAATGAPAIATTPEAIARPGASVTYEWWIADDEPEGTHYFHSHGDDRLQTSHSLFGALIVEPKGSIYLDPVKGIELRSGWAAMIQDPNGSDFREFAIMYHEIGNDRYRQLDKNGRLVPFIDPFTGAYKPGGRAINYRSEPFLNRLQLQQQSFGRFDLSLAYSSYAFGDPATPIARSYLGDPVKQRVVHGGSEVFHVHHVHGGAIRWRRQPGVEPAGFDRGLDKHPPLLPEASERLDSQALGPAEQYDIEDECGSGGCQQSAGDFLIHCHVAHHYVAGMWGIWRVYNTLQDGAVAQDTLPPLQELPDRRGRMRPAVTAQDLVGRTVDWYGTTFQITQDNLAAWVAQMLPPSGVPNGYDASVLDWRVADGEYLNEPESDQSWPGFHSPAPGRRLPIRFDPATGKLAYPFLRPHLSKRPPFAPNHGPAPFLDPSPPGAAPPQPGASGPGSLCPTGTKPKDFTIHAINLPIALNTQANLIDPSGEIFVLKEQEDAVRADDSLKTPLVIRANAGEDCVDVLLKSELEDTRENSFFSKVGLHIHFAQFDVQGSDGVSAGFNYEQAVRPFTVEGAATRSNVSAGATSLRLGDLPSASSPAQPAPDDPSGAQPADLLKMICEQPQAKAQRESAPTDAARRFQPGALVGIGMDQDTTFEVGRIKQINGDTLIFDAPLRYEHAQGEIVSTEFVRYRWYPDAQVGTVYFHDHVSALTSWKHGLFGALIVEPPGSTYHDPQTGQAIHSGLLADIHTTARVAADLSGSFRELVLLIQDGNPQTHAGDSSGSSFNLRVEPPARRGGDPARLFSSTAHSDPATPLLQSFLGDPIVIRGLVPGANDVHTLHIDGHWFRLEPFSASSPPISTVHIGISERADLVIPRAGGPQGLSGDYLYYNGRAFKLREGSWGLLRVHDGAANTLLQKLPGHEAIPAPSPVVCPAGAPRKAFDIAAVEASLPMLGGMKGKIYVLQADKVAVRSGERPPEPLVLHVNVGDCVTVNLTNELPAGPVSFHTDMLATDPRESQGVQAGRNPAQAVLPGKTRVYTYFAHPEFGETVALVRDWGDVLEHPRLGLYGAIVVGPRGATYTHPLTGEDMSLKAGWRVDVHPPAGASYRDVALFIQDEDPAIGTALMPYSEHVQGIVGLNYRSEPLQQRLAKDKDTANVFRSDVHGDPATPLIEAFAGDPVRVHVLVPFSEQAHVFNVEGHQWPLEPDRPGADRLSSVQVGGLEAISIKLEGGAGGRTALPGDFLYGDHREPYREAGLWGILRVYAPTSPGVKLQPLVAVKD